MLSKQNVTRKFFGCATLQHRSPSLALIFCSVCFGLYIWLYPESTEDANLVIAEKLDWQRIPSDRIHCVESLQNGKFYESTIGGKNIEFYFSQDHTVYLSENNRRLVEGQAQESEAGLASLINCQTIHMPLNIEEI